MNPMRPKMRRRWMPLLTVWLTVWTGPLGATAAATAPDEAAWVQRLALPPLAPTREVISALPQVQAARADMDLALARQQGLQVGSHEWTLRLGTQQRSETAGTRYTESDVALERAVRWGGKAQADRDLGEAGVLAARAGYADRWHEAVRGLLQDWFAWQRARSAAQVQGAQTTLAQQQLTLAERRVRAGDVPRLDVLMAQAEHDRAQAQQAQAEGQAAQQRIELDKRYPGLALDGGVAGVAEAAAVPWPGAPADAMPWVQRMLDDNHEIERAEAEVQVARLRSERARLDTRPDPLLGVRSARERGGAENVVGAYLAIPLAGRYRASEEKAALAQLAAAEQGLRQTRQRVEAGAQRVVLRATQALATWQRLAAVDQAMARVAELGMKAYSLGEMTLTEALQSRRAALEAALAAQAARWDALEAVSRVLVDAHALWAADDGAH